MEEIEALVEFAQRAKDITPRFPEQLIHMIKKSLWTEIESNFVSMKTYNEGGFATRAEVVRGLEESNGNFEKLRRNIGMVSKKVDEMGDPLDKMREDLTFLNFKMKKEVASHADVKSQL